MIEIIVHAFLPNFNISPILVHVHLRTLNSKCPKEYYLKVQLLFNTDSKLKPLMVFFIFFWNFHTSISYN